MKQGHDSTITIRLAGHADERELRRLAGLDSSAVPPAPVLVAFAGSRARAAISLSSGEALADPFHRTEGLLSMLRLRLEQLRSPGRRRPRGRLLSGGLGGRRPSPGLTPRTPGGLRPSA